MVNYIGKNKFRKHKILYCLNSKLKIVTFTFVILESQHGGVLCMFSMLLAQYGYVGRHFSTIIINFPWLKNILNVLVSFILSIPNIITYDVETLNYVRDQNTTYFQYEIIEECVQNPSYFWSNFTQWYSMIISYALPSFVLIVSYIKILTFMASNAKKLAKTSVSILLVLCLASFELKISSPEYIWRSIMAEYQCTGKKGY